MSTTNRLRFTVLALVAVVGTGCSRDPSQTKRRYLESGQHYFDSGKYEEASIQFRKAIQVDQRFGDAYFRLGQSYIKLQRWQEAFSAMGEAVELDPGKTEAHLRLGELYLQDRDFSKSEQEALTVLDREAENAEAFELLAASYVGLGRQKEARDAFQKVSQLRPQDVSVLLNLALLEVGVRDIDAAEQDFRRATDIDPGYSPAYIDFANFYRLKQNLPRAEAVLRTGTLHNPNDSTLALALADVLYAQRRGDAAEEVLASLRTRNQQSDVALSIGDLYFVRSRMDAALGEYYRALQISPKDLDAKRRLVKWYLANDQAGNAAWWNDQILLDNAKDLDANIARGRILMAEQQVNSATELLRAQVNEAGDSPEAHCYLGIALWQRGDLNAAKGELQEAIKLNPDMLPALEALSQVHMSLGEHALAVEFATRAVQHYPENVPAKLLLGAAYLKKGDTGKAREQFLEALQIAPHDPQTHLNLALAYLTEHRSAEAERELNAVLEQDPHSSDAVGQLADLWIAEGQSSKALVRTEQYANENDTDPNAHLILGSVYTSREDYLHAEQELTRAIHLNPKLSTAYLKLGQLYEKQNRKDAAIRCYEDALKLLPEFVALYALLGNLQLADGHLAEAQSYYERALAIDPNFALAASNLAWTLVKRGRDLDRAMQLAQKARQLMPQLDSIVDTLAWVEYEKGDYRSALPLLQECIQKSPANSMYHYHLGMVLIATGEKQKAREELRSALRLKLPSDDADSANEVLARLQ